MTLPDAAAALEVQQPDEYVVISIDSEQNLYVDEKFSWDAKYIPAYVRRYPFVLAGDEIKPDSTYTVCIDENFSGFNRKSGERLFTDKGKMIL